MIGYAQERLGVEVERDAVDAGPPPRRRRTLHNWLPVGVGVSVFALTVARLLLAGPGLDRLWAEDGFIFLWDAKRYGPGSFLYTYAGYLHTTPRALALVGSQLPLAAFAAFAALAAAATAGTLAAVVFASARRVTGSASWAALVAVSFACIPAFRGLVGSMANLQWLFLAAAFWCLLDRTGPRWLLGGVTLLASLTTPLTALLLPAALLLQRRSSLRSVPVLGLVLGGVVQAAAILLSPTSTANQEVRHAQVSEDLFEVFVRSVTGPSVKPQQLGEFGVLETSTLLGLVVGGLVLLCVHGARTRRAPALAAVLSGGLVFFVTSVLTGHPTTRYAACAALLLVSAVVLVGPELTRALRWTTVAALVTIMFLSFPANQHRLSGSSWQSDVEAHLESCASTGRGTPIPVSPIGWGEIDPDCPAASN